jgi:bacillithiol biosynthesis deacetylase BshB1
MKADVLAFGAHPDDVEISAGGTVARLVAEGRTVVVADLTRGELGSRGSGDLRLIEAAKAGEILGLAARENLEMADGFFTHSEENIRKIIHIIRKYKPEIVFANSITDRHPDHGKGAKLVADACFLSGLRRIHTHDHGKQQEHWRPKALYHYIQDYYIEPDFVYDVTPYFETKMASIKAFSSQFYDPQSEEPETPISGKDFFDFLEARAKQMGRPAGYTLAEGFTTSRVVGVSDIFSLD